MEQALERPGIIAIVSDCKECRGLGIKIGPFDDELGDRIVRECAHCNGFGIRITRRRAEAVEAGRRKAGRDGPGRGMAGVGSPNPLKVP